MRFTLNAVALLAVGFASVAWASDADVVRQSEDRAQIQELMWKYVRALDSYNADAYAATFTEDGQFGSGARAVKGREALVKMVHGLKPAAGVKEPAMHHVISNAHVEFTGKDQARYYAYWMTVFAAEGEGKAPRVAAVGRSIDELVRVNGKWLIKSRNVAPQD